MSVIKRSDVKNHFSPRYLRELHLSQPAGQPDTAGVSVAEPDAIKANPKGFAQDFLVEHFSSNISFVPSQHSTASIDAQAPKVPKSSQA